MEWILVLCKLAHKLGSIIFYIALLALLAIFDEMLPNPVSNNANKEDLASNAHFSIENTDFQWLLEKRIIDLL